MNNILWRRLRYMLTPQFDLYQHIAGHLAGKRVLEVGFGTGLGTVQLARHATLVRACEISREAVLFAQKTLPLRNVHWMEYDIMLRADLRGVYHAAVMVEVLEHIEDWHKALANVRGLLRADGKLYITARNRNADLRRNDLHEREWTAAEFKAALRLYFADVKLFDYTLTTGLDESTHVTPLIAVAIK